MRPVQSSISRSAGYLPIALIVAAISAALLGCTASKPKVEEAAPSTSTAPTDPAKEQAAFYLFMEGTTLYEEGKLDAAAAAFERALLFDPASTEIRLSLGETYFALRRFEKTLATIDGAIDRSPQILELQARTYRFLGRDDDAAAVYRQLITLDSTDVEAWWYLSRLDLRRGRMDDAVIDLERLARLRADARVYNELGELHHRMGDYESALAAYKESLKFDSSFTSRDAHVGMAGAFEGLGRFSEAIAAYRMVIAMSPPMEFSAHRRLIQLFLAADQPDSAIAVIEEILRDRPDDPERLRLGILWYSTGHEERAESLFTALEGHVDPYLPEYYRGRIAADRNDYQDAKRHFRAAIASADSFPDAWIHLGQALQNQDSLHAALAVAHRGIEATGDTRGFWYFIGLSFSRAGQYDSAVYWLDRLWHQDTLNSRVEFSLAASLERAGHFDSAVTVFNHLIAREPDNDLALNYLGYMYADSGIKLDLSLDLVQRALQRDPENSAYRDSYGWVLYRLGRFSEAESELRRALNQLESDPTIHDHMGDILAALGRRDEALSHWRKALELEPESDEIRTKLGM